MRLAAFVDQVFWRDGATLSTDEAYILFLASFAGHVDEVVLIGREAPAPGRGPYPLGAPFSLCPMPYYSDLSRVWRVDPRRYGRFLNTIRERARGWDAVLVGGPHPIGQVVARICIALGVPVLLVVRQNLTAQVGTRTGWKRRVAIGAARVLEADFRRLARGRTVFAVGREMADAYGRSGARVHDHRVCLVGREQRDALSGMPAGTDPTRLICVGRLAPEKGYPYLFEALARLRDEGLACRLDMVGTGALEADLRDRAERLGLTGQIAFHGYVPYGPSLFALYARAGALVLPSTTEGFPQVIDEALSVGLPVIATAVGGIPACLTDGETALLVPPRDVPALAAAIARLIRDPALRVRLRERGRALMDENTLEANRSRVLEGVRHAIAHART